MEVGAVKQDFNTEVILLKKKLNQAKIQIIHKLTRKAKQLTEKKAPEKLQEKLKRKAESAVKEVLVIKKIKPKDLAKFIVTHKGELNTFLNKPQVDEDKACARLLLHKALQDKYKFIRGRFSNVSIQDLFLSRLERRKIKKEAKEKQKNKKKAKNNKVVNSEGDWNVEDVATLVMDNFYNSPLLSRTLKAQKTDTMGTIRLNREFVPDCLRSKTKLNMRVGEVVHSQTEDLSVLVWRDSNLVSLISTYHKVEISGIEKYGTYKYKPQVVLDYNLSMGGVDKKDQLLQAFPVERVRNMVWYKKLFRRLLNVSIHNTYVIFCNKKKVPQREFRMNLANQILNEVKLPRPVARPTTVSVDPFATGHFPIRAPGGKSRCKHCHKAGVETRTVYKCDTCGVRLCIACFRNYHIPSEEQL